MQLTYPGARISTLQEVFDFVECADPSHNILWNIESKIDAECPDRTAGVHDFVQKQHAVFSASPYRHSVTYQSFDWRTLVAMKDFDPGVVTSALIDDETAAVGHRSPWLAGRHIYDSPGAADVQIALAAWSINADILSPYSHTERATGEPGMIEYVPFVTKEMVDMANRHGLAVKPWTVNRLNLVEQIVDLKVNGIITDYPNVVRSWARQRGISIAPKFPKRRVLACLEKHMKI
jgi:glycerophosphoryl diester phosphodiesterase